MLLNGSQPVFAKVLNYIRDNDVVQQYGIVVEPTVFRLLGHCFTLPHCHQVWTLYLATLEGCFLLHKKG